MMREANQIVGSTVRLPEGGSVHPFGETRLAEALTDGRADTGLGWRSGGETSGLEATFRQPVNADVVVCRWTAMPADYVVEARRDGEWRIVDEVAGNTVLGPKIKLHLPADARAEGLRVRIIRVLTEDIHERENAAPFPAFLGGLEVYGLDRLPGPLQSFLNRETPRLVSSPERVAEARSQGNYRPDPGLLTRPIPSWEPIPRALYFGKVTGKEQNEKVGAMRQLVVGCATAYERSGDERYAARGREGLLAVLSHYDRYQTFRFRGIEWKAVTYQDPAYYIDELTRAYDLLASSACLTVQDRLRFVYGMLDLGDFQCVALRERFVSRENWAANSVAEIALLALYLDGFPETRNWLAAAEDRFADCFEHFLEDGTWWECSPCHAEYMLRGMLKYGLARHLMGDPIWRRDYNGKTLESLVEVQATTATPFGEYPSINDTTGHERPMLASAPEMRAPLYLMGRGDLLEILRDREGPPFVPGIDVGAPERATPSYTSVLLPDAGFAVMRDGWREEDGYLILDYGPHGGGHGHPDKLNFILIADGHHWVPDAGNSPHYSIFPEQKTWHKQTVSHNTVLANGESQEPCTGERVFWHHDDEVDAVCARHTEGYPGLTHCRTIVHPRGDYYLIHDVLDAKEGAFDLEWLLHVNGEVEGQEPGKLWFRHGEKRLLLMCDAIGPERVTFHQGLCGGFRQSEWSGPGYPDPGDPGWIYVPFIRLPKHVEAGGRAEFTALLVPFGGEAPDVRLEPIHGGLGGVSGARIRYGEALDEYLGGFQRSINGQTIFSKTFDGIA